MADEKSTYSGFYTKKEKEKEFPFFTTDVRRRTFEEEDVKISKTISSRKGS